MNVKSSDVVFMCSLRYWSAQILLTEVLPIWVFYKRFLTTRGSCWWLQIYSYRKLFIYFFPD